MCVTDIMRRSFRILLIINEFSEKDIFKHEVSLQKIEFYLRNPDHFALFLLRKYEEKKLNLQEKELKKIIQEVIFKEEIELSIESMKKYRFGAFENLNKVYSLLIGAGYLSIQRGNSKEYKITFKGKEKIQEMEKSGEFQWYFERIRLLKFFLYNYIATELKNFQYESKVYKEAEYHDYIPNELENVKLEFMKIFKEELKNE